MDQSAALRSLRKPNGRGSCDGGAEQCGANPAPSQRAALFAWHSLLASGSITSVALGQYLGARACPDIGSARTQREPQSGGNAVRVVAL
jgi:hypothetical protein